jgi:hypothetical protein
LGGDSFNIPQAVYYTHHYINIIPSFVHPSLIFIYKKYMYSTKKGRLSKENKASENGLNDYRSPSGIRQKEAVSDFETASVFSVYQL